MISWRSLTLVIGLVLASYGARAQTQCVANAVAGGTPDAITIPSLPCIPTTAFLVLTTSGANATSTPTISVAGQPPQVILRSNNTALHAGDLPPAGSRAILTNNGKNWFLLNWQGFAGGTGSSTSGQVLVNSSGNIAGQPVGVTGTNTIVETNSNGKLDPTLVPSQSITVAGQNGNLQVNSNGTLGALALGPSLGTIVNGTELDFSPNAACFNLGPWSGDLSGPACTPPSLSAGAAARNLGPASGAIGGSWNATTLNGPAVISALGIPSGDLGGSSFSAPQVKGLRGFPIATTPPSTQSALVWDGTQYSPQSISPGINQLNGDVVAGPGTGTQTSIIQSQAVNNVKLALMAPATVKANPSGSIGGSTPQDIPVTGGLGFVNGALQITNVGTSQQYTVAAGDCLTINNGFVTGIIPGVACSSGGDTLTADDGATVIQADDSLTSLIVDGAVVTATPCTAIQSDFSLTTGCNVPFIAAFLK